MYVYKISYGIYVHYVFILSLFPQDENVASADDDDLEETSTFDINVCILY